MNPHTVEYAIGAVFVALYSIERINTPKIDLKTTTPQRYWSMVLLYVLATLAIYLLFTHILFVLGTGPLKAPLETFLGIKIGADTSPPVLMALVLTVLLAKIPGLSTLDEALRSEFRHRASMSSIAGNLSNLLEHSPLQLSAARQAEITAKLTQQGIDAANVIFVDNQTPQYTWTRIAVLLEQVRRWKVDSPYANFVTAFASDWEAIVRDAEESSAKAIRCFRLGNVADADPALASALKDCRGHYAEQLGTLLRKLCDFMGRGVATVSGNNAERRRTALAEIGLDVQFPVGYTLDQIAFVLIIALGGSILLPPLIALMVGSQTSYLQPYVLKVAAGYTIAALLALKQYQYYGQALRPGMQRPWGRYLMVGVLAAVLTGIFNVGLDLLLAPHEIKTRGFYYLLRPLVFGILITYLIDTRVPIEQLRLRQWKETAIAAVVMAATSGAIWLILNNLCPPGTAGCRSAPSLLMLALSSTVVGAVLGYWLPTSTRRIIKRVSDRVAPALAGAPRGLTVP
jgi:hypothetical protein